jgi:hypothetical protein
MTVDRLVENDNAGEPAPVAPRSAPRSPRRWVAIGTGVAIEIRGTDLEALVVRSRPSGPAIAGAVTIADFRERAATEWGAEFKAWAKKLGVAHLPVTILLPRRDVIVRVVTLPGVSDRDLAAAITFQIDSLHPYPEDEAVWTFVRIGKTSSVLVGISRREVVERYAALFAEAGIKMAAITFSAAAIYSALRLFSTPPGGLIAIAASEAGVEVYGEGPARPVFSAAVTEAGDRAIRMAAADLRLPMDTIPAQLHEILPAPRIAPDGLDLSAQALVYAAALASACPRLALGANLLPENQRSTSSRAMFIPTIVLAVVLGVLLISLGFYQRWEERRYISTLEAEITKLEPRARRVASLERAIADARARAELLDRFRRRSRADLDAVSEVTKLIAPPGWVGALELNRDSVVVQGEAEQSAPLLKIIDSSALFMGSEFTLPPARAGANELFRIRALREGPR